MKVWLYAKRLNGGYNYIHIIKGTLVNDERKNRVFVEKSLIRYGNHIEQYFTRPGGTMIMATQKEESYTDVKRGLVRWIFDGSIDLASNRSFDTEVIK